MFPIGVVHVECGPLARRPLPGQADRRHVDVQLLGEIPMGTRDLLHRNPSQALIRPRHEQHRSRIVLAGLLDEHAGVLAEIVDVGLGDVVLQDDDIERTGVDGSDSAFISHRTFRNAPPATALSAVTTSGDGAVAASLSKCV